MIDRREEEISEEARRIAWKNAPAWAIEAGWPKPKEMEEKDER